MSTLGRYRIERLPWNSATAADIMEAGRRRHHVAALVELDVTRARELLRAHHARTGRRLSFTGWLAHCTARALIEHPELNVHRLGRWHEVRFEDVDVLIIVEREAGGARRPLPLVVRRANEKTVAEITDELRAAQAEAIGAARMVLDQNGSGHWLARVPKAAALYPLLPVWLRRAFWSMLAHDAFSAKRMMGTVGITAVGMMGRLPGWPLTVGEHTVDLAVGSVVKKPGAVGDQIAIREMLALTLLVDHDLVDGAPAARFAARLGELIEQASGLEERDEAAPGRPACDEPPPATSPVSNPPSSASASR
jgi:pyruvate/2-oxoglutarate dehydrogenase complex dihydrolipoamide acyltransferase (E2) component